MKVTLPTHAKTYALADELQTTTAEAVGILAILWNYCKQYARDGDLTRLTPTHLARIIGRGPKDGPGVFAALHRTGWIDPHPHNTGAWIIHDWLQHCEGYIIRDLAKQNRLDAEQERSTPPSRLYKADALPSTAMQCDALQSTANPCSPSPTPSPPPLLSPSPLPSSRRTAATEPPDRAGSGSFDAWWASYPVRGPGIPRGNRKKAWAEWVKLGDDARAEVVEATRRLVKSGTYPKDAERFLKGSKGADPPYRAYLDDSPAPVVSGASKPTAAQVKESRNYEYDSSWLDEFGSKGDKA